jgi:hypothetical protein
MTDLSTIRVIPFYEKIKKWPTWSEKFFSKAKRFGFKDILLERSIVTKIDEVFDAESEEGKKKMILSDLNKLAYTKLILSINDKAISRKDYVDGNAFMAWKRFKYMFEPDCALKKNQDPEIWITELDNPRMKLGELGSRITENQFMVHMLNNMIFEYNPQ